MNCAGCVSSANRYLSLCAAAALTLIGSSANAAVPTNKYTFNDNTAHDSVGGADGVIVDNTGISKFVGGAFDMSANNGANSNQDFNNPATVGAFIDLPNGVFTNAVDTGTFGAVSLEVWFTTQQNRGWAEVYSFGHNDAGNAGEGMSSGGGSYAALIPTAGDAPNDFRATTRDQTAMAESYVNHDAPLTALPVGVKQHVVFVLDHNDTNGGVNLNGTERLYLNGNPVGSNAIATFLDSVDLSDVNNWLGRSQWGDPLYDGSIDEFRIYNTALTPGEVTTSFATGPDPAPLPVLIVNRGTGAMSLANQTAGNVQIKGYSVTSADGSLNPLTWTSINAGNAFDPDGTWTAQSSTSMNLAESVTGGVTDGGSLAPATSRGIGAPWLKSPFEDVAFNFTLGDGSVGNGAVQYIGTPLARSDLNGDGMVTAADWALFVPNSFKSFPGETMVGAYLKGDLDGDLDNDYNDFLIFKTDFIAAQGASAFAQLTGAVPEPSSLVLAAMTCVMLLGTSRDRRET
jgi:Concanavalin A-like lectin/glucanases superfamily